MPRASKLSEAQWEALRQRVLSGESASALGREFGISESGVRKRLGANSHLLASESAKVREVALKIADADNSLRELPESHRPAAISLAETLKSISGSLARAADLGAKTAHRLQSLSNSEVAKVDDADPMSSIDNLKNVGVLTKLANESASIALNLLAANKETVVKFSTEIPKSAGLPVKRLSTEALREIVAAKNG